MKNGTGVCSYISKVVCCWKLKTSFLCFRLVGFGQQKPKIGFGRNRNKTMVSLVHYLIAVNFESSFHVRFHLTSFEVGHLVLDWRDISLTLFFQLYTLRKLNQGDAADPRAPLSGNFRPIQALNGRTIRTNIFLAPAEGKEVRNITCSSWLFCI